MKTASEWKGHSVFITTAKSIPEPGQAKSALALETWLRIEQSFELAVLPLSIRLDQVEARHQRNGRRVEEVCDRVQWLHQDLKESGLLECEKSGALKKMKELSLIHSLVTSTHERRGDKSKEELCRSTKAHLLADNLLHFTQRELQEKGEVEQNLAKYFKRETRAVILRRKKLMADVRNQVIDQKQQIDLVRGSGRKTPRAARRTKTTAGTPLKAASTQAFENILHLLEHASSIEADEAPNEKENLEETEHPKDSTAVCSKPPKRAHARCLEPAAPEDHRPDSLSPGRKLTDDELVQFLIRNYSKPLQEKKSNLQAEAQPPQKTPEAPSCFRMSSEERRSLVKRMLAGERPHHQMTPEKPKSASDKSQSPKEAKRNFAFGKLSSTERKEPSAHKRSLTPEERKELISSYLRKEVCLNHMKLAEQPRPARKSETVRNFAFGKLSRSDSKFSSKVRSLSPEERRELMERYLKKEAEFTHMKVSEELLSQAKERRSSRDPHLRSFQFGIHHVFPESNEDCMPKSLTRSERKEAMRKNLREHELFHHQLPKQKTDLPSKPTTSRKKKPPSTDRLAQLSKPRLRTEEKPKTQPQTKKPPQTQNKPQAPAKLSNQDRPQKSTPQIPAPKIKQKESTPRPPPPTSPRQPRQTKPPAASTKKVPDQHKIIAAEGKTSKQRPAEEPTATKPAESAPLQRDAAVVEELVSPTEDEMWVPPEEHAATAPPDEEELLPADEEDFIFSDEADPDEPDPNAAAVSLREASDGEQQQGEVRVTSD
jgi:hypothetical protein